MQPSQFVAVLITIGLLNCSGLAQPQGLPFIQRRVCPFEFGCNFHPWIFMAPVKAYAQEGDTSSLSFLFQPNDSVVYNFGNMYIEKPGVAVLTQDYDSLFKAKDTIYVLTYRGEGFYDVWYRGRIEYVEAFWQDEPSNTEATLLSPPLMTWWVNVTSRNGKAYWIRLINTSSDGIGFDEPIKMVQKGFENY